MNIEDIRAEVFRLKPRFAEVVKTWGDKTLLEYYAQGFTSPPRPTDDIVRVISNEVTKILGADVARETRKTIEKHRWVNTADHHGLLHHPYFYTTSLALSHPEISKGASVTIALPFGGVSLGNDSFPRGFSFHDTNVELQKVFFKSLKYQRLPVYALTPMTHEALTQEKHRATSLSLTKKARERLQHFFEQLLSDARVWSQDTYSTQLTVMNSILWRELFGETRGDFVYLEMDTVVRSLLLEKHLLTETHIYNLLFKSDWRKKFIELFNGIQGAHDNTSGTHFFWYIDYISLTRRRLITKNGALTTPEGDVNIQLTPEHIARGLENRTLMPSTALSLIIIQEEENLTCGGGPNQIHYLTEYITQWRKLLGHFGEEKNENKPSVWCEDCAIFRIVDVLETKHGVATLIDILLHTEDRSNLVNDTLSSIHIKSAIDTMIPTLHTLFTREKITLGSPSGVHQITIE